jgi:hypothetical protein
VRELMRSLWLKDDRGSDVVDDGRAAGAAKPASSE